MADRFRGRIVIGGRVSKETVKQILTEAEGTEENPSLQDVLDMQDLELEDRELAMGEFHDVEQFLERQRIPFIRYSDSYHEYPPERVAFRPDLGWEKPVVEPVTESGTLEGVHVETLKNIRDAVNKSDTHRAQTLLDELVPLELPDLPPLEIG